MSAHADDPTLPSDLGAAWLAGWSCPGETELWPVADWQELANFLGQEASADALAATQRRLATDARFAALAAPLLAFWATPLPSAPVDLDAAWAAIERKAALQRQAARVAPSQPSPPPAVARGDRRFPVRNVSRAPRRWRADSSQWLIAGLLVVVAAYLALYIGDRPRERALHYYAATGATHTVHLGDGSQVTLAPGATLVTDGVAPGTANSASRTVHLDGSGTFTVHADPSHPFIVETHDVAAVAIGTVFHVAAAPERMSTTNPAVSSTKGSQPFTTDIQISVTSGKVMVQRRTIQGHRETLAVLGPGQETSVQTFTRYFKAGWAAGAAHKSVADAYLEYQAMKAADSMKAAQTAPSQ